ncbi:MAG: extracellular solute-binding protein [Firmicutes bacterium]|nr:extracellular solute-binding protein [Bacillota bacterium]
MGKAWRKAWKKGAVLVLAVMMLLSAGACGTQGPDTAPVGDEGESADKSTADSNFNPTGLPIVNEPVTLRLMVRRPRLAKQSFEEREIYKKRSKDTNVNIQWEEIASSGFQEKVNLAINSGDLPDGIYAGGIQQHKFGEVIEAGLITPLDDYIQYAPNLKKLMELYPVVKKASTFEGDGKIYRYSGYNLKPFAAVAEPFFINSDWLENLGLEMPETTEELYTVLKAFKEKDANGNGDPNDEIPISFHLVGRNVTYRWMLASWDLLAMKTQADTTIRNGVLDFNPVNERYRSALEYFHRLYREGLMDPESITQDLPTINAKIYGDTQKIGVFSAWALKKGKHWDSYELLLPVEGPFGDRKMVHNHDTQITNGLIIFKDCKHPAALVRWVDHLNDGVNAIENWGGPEGLAWVRDEANKTWDIDYEGLEKKGRSFQEVRHSTATQNGPDMSKITEITGYEYVGFEKDPKMEWSNRHKPFFMEERWPVGDKIRLVTDRDREIALLWTDLQNHIRSFEAEAVINGMDDDKWNAHITQCEKLKYKEIVAYWQERYNEMTEED